jgi:hypothetical protein
MKDSFVGREVSVFREKLVEKLVSGVKGKITDRFDLAP